MKFTSNQCLLIGVALLDFCSALPHRDGPRERLAQGLELDDKYYTYDSESKKPKTPYRPDYRDPYDSAVDTVGQRIDPKPFRNGHGASILGPWNPERARQNPDMIRPPTTDHGDVANMRWSYVDSHIRIEVRDLR